MVKKVFYFNRGYSNHSIGSSIIDEDSVFNNNASTGKNYVRDFSFFFPIGFTLLLIGGGSIIGFLKMYYGFVVFEGNFNQEERIGMTF